ETFRTSRVAWSVCIAHVCRRMCGLTFLTTSEVVVRAAVATCFFRTYSKPDRVIACALALRNNSGALLAGRTFSHAFMIVAVSFQSGRTRSPALTDDAHAGHGLEIDLIEAQTHQFRHAQARAESHAQVWCVEQSLQLLAREVADQGQVGLLHGDGMDPTRLVDAGRQPVFQIAEERVDRGESGVSCSRRVAAFFLQMLQERQDERRIELFKLDLRGR